MIIATLPVTTRDETKLDYIGKGCKCTREIICGQLLWALLKGVADVMRGTVHLEGRQSLSNWPGVEPESPFFDGNSPLRLCKHLPVLHENVRHGAYGYVRVRDLNCSPRWDGQLLLFDILQARFWPKSRTRHLRSPSGPLCLHTRGHDGSAA